MATGPREFDFLAFGTGVSSGYEAQAWEKCPERATTLKIFGPRQAVWIAGWSICELRECKIDARFADLCPFRKRGMRPAAKATMPNAVILNQNTHRTGAAASPVPFRLIHLLLVFGWTGCDLCANRPT